MNNQKLFDYMKDEHGVTLLQQDMQEIERIVNEMQQTDVSDSFAVCPDCGCELKIVMRPMTNQDLISAIQANNR